MILRKFMTHTTDQNWFAVGLDVIVVITGIFLGMQVTEWNEARKERLLERVYLERLYEDFQVNKKTLSNIVQMHQGYFDHMTTVAKYLQDGIDDKELHDRLTAKRLGDGVLPSLGLQSGTYDELISTGRINILQSHELRKVLQAAVSSYSFATSQLDYFRADVHQQEIIIDKMRNITVPSDGGIRIIRNYQPFLGDQALINVLGKSAAKHFLIGRYRQGSLAATLDGLNLLACALGKPECETEDVP